MSKRVIIALLVLTVLSSCAINVGQAPIKIGAISELSGVGKDFGLELKQIFDLRIQQWNDKGGINGRPLELIWRDSDCSFDTAREVVSELVDKEGVSIVIGGACSDGVYGALEVTQPNNVIMMSSAATSPGLSQENSYFFRTIPSDATQGTLFANYLQNSDISTVVALIEETTYTSGILDVFMNNYDGLIKVMKLNLEDEEFDVEAVVSRASNFGADRILLLVQSTDRSYQIFSKLVREGWKGGIITNEAVILNSDIVRDFKNYLAAREVVGAVDILEDSKKEEIEEFSVQYQKYYGKQIEFLEYAGASVDLIDVLVETLSNAESVDDTEELNESLHAVQHVGLSGNVSFDIYGDVRGSLSLVHFVKDKFVKFIE